MAKAAAAKKPPTKSEVLANVSAATNLPKPQVAAVLEAYTASLRRTWTAPLLQLSVPRQMSRICWLPRHGEVPALP